MYTVKAASRTATGSPRGRDVIQEGTMDRIASKVAVALLLVATAGCLSSPGDRSSPAGPATTSQDGAGSQPSALTSGARLQGATIGVCWKAADCHLPFFLT